MKIFRNQSNPRVPHTEASADSNMRIDWRAGIDGFFDIDGITIQFRGSIWTSREQVWIDDELVSDRSSGLSLCTGHEFGHAGIRYRLEVRSRLRDGGGVELLLYRNDDLIDRDFATYDSRLLARDEHGRLDWRRRWPMLLIAFVGGLAGGAVGAWLAFEVIGSLAR